MLHYEAFQHHQHLLKENWSISNTCQPATLYFGRHKSGTELVCNRQMVSLGGVAKFKIHCNNKLFHEDYMTIIFLCLFVLFATFNFLNWN